MADIEKLVYYSNGSKKVLKSSDRLVIQSGGLAFEGSTDDDYETQLAVEDPTADRTLTLPNATDTLVGKNTTDTLTNKTLTSVVLNTGVSGTAIKDEDNMLSNSNTHLATQQSIKAYVDTQVSSSSSVSADDITTGDAAVTLATSTGNITLDAQGNDTDIIFKGTDGGSDTTFLTLDGSAAGAATFNSGITVGGNLIPSSANTYSLGSATAEWSDLYMGDGSKIYLGNDQDVYLEHDPDDGIQMHMSSEGAIEPTFSIVHNNASSHYQGPSLQLHNTTMDSASDLIGSIRFTGASVSSSTVYASGLGGNSGTGTNIYFNVCPSGATQQTALDITGVSNTNGTIVRINDHNGSTTGLKLGNTLVTASGTDLNILDGVTSTTSEINLLDGGTAVGSSITVADADGFIINDAGIMKTIPASDLKTYIGAGAADDITTGDAAVTLATSAGNITIDAQGNDTDIIFKGTDNTADITMLTLDGSAAGEATFNAGIITGGNITPAASDTYSLGSSSAEWSDLYLGDNSKIYFGNDQDVFLTHSSDSGLFFEMNSSIQDLGDPSFTIRTNVANTTANGPSVTLQKVYTQANDLIGRIILRGNSDYHSVFETKYLSSTADSEYSQLDMRVLSGGTSAINTGASGITIMGNASSSVPEVLNNGPTGLKVISGDPSSRANYSHIYSKDVSSSAEVFVQDEAGNVTQISPHSEEGDWIYWSENVKTGKKVKVNMEKMIKRLEVITGESFFEEYVEGN